jgi:hypothetical protein
MQRSSTDTLTCIRNDSSPRTLAYRPVCRGSSAVYLYCIAYPETLGIKPVMWWGDMSQYDTVFAPSNVQL